jgi:hypothetical protein
VLTYRRRNCQLMFGCVNRCACTQTSTGAVCEHTHSQLDPRRHTYLYVRGLAQILNRMEVPFETVDVLTDDMLRTGMKEYSQVPRQHALAYI